MKTVQILAIFVIATAATGWAAIAPSSDCGPTLSIKDPQLRATFAALERNPESAQFCAFYRAQTTQASEHVVR